MNDIKKIRLASNLKQEIRHFFNSMGYLEVDTPVRIPCPALEDYIDAIPASKTYGESHYLRTSPELHLKRFLAESSGELQRVFQLGVCFRQGEIGTQHQEEFTMLEWYRLHANYRDILDETIKLFRHLQDQLNVDKINFRGQTFDFHQPWEILTVTEAFERYATVSLVETIRQAVFEEVLTEQVEPNLGKGVPTVLIDYPSEFAALARVSPTNPQVCERWELYVGGLELANCYSELVDPIEQKLRFEQTMALRKRNGAEVYPIDQAFLQSLENLPNCSGIALGVERLCMVFTNSNEITEVKFT